MFPVKCTVPISCTYVPILYRWATYHVGSSRLGGGVGVLGCSALPVEVGRPGWPCVGVDIGPGEGWLEVQRTVAFVLARASHFNSRIGRRYCSERLIQKRSVFNPYK